MKNRQPQMTEIFNYTSSRKGKSTTFKRQRTTGAKTRKGQPNGCPSSC
jgi:hypothetical protein